MTHAQKNPRARNISRRQRINRLIDRHYGQKDFTETEDEESLFCQSLTVEMIEVVEVHAEGCLVRKFTTDKEIRTFHWPDGLLPLLQPGDVFLASLGLKNGSWNILSLGRLYKTFFSAAGVDEQLEFAHIG